MTDQLVHELVEQSRDRVAHVRAGQRLIDVLDAQPNVDGFHLPPIAASALVRLPHPKEPKAHGLRSLGRKRAAVATTSATTTPSSSFEQYAQYARSKPTNGESVHMLNRRKAVATNSEALTTLVARVVAADSEPTAAAKLLQAVAVDKGRHAFLQLKHKVRTAQVPDTKNKHAAFLEFRRADVPTITVDTTPLLNAATRAPLRYGDAVCLLSLAVNVPLAIGRHGRTITVSDAVIGPHTVFTIVDFRNPSRRSDVAPGDAFWLRVYESQVDMGPQDDVLALVQDTHYYLGGPGAKEEEEPIGNSAAKHAVQTDSAFKLVAMKASVPSAAYYGDDVATREVAIETNAPILRLAQWRFVAATETDDALVLNCAHVQLRLDHWTLEMDPVRQRGVLRGSLARDETSSLGHSRRPVTRDAAVWQVRLVQQGDAPVSDEDPHASLEWLERHRDRATREAKAVDAKRTLVRDAHAAYEAVATRSNAQLVAIETRKAAHHRAYFERRGPQVLDRKLLKLPRL